MRYSIWSIVYAIKHEIVLLCLPPFVDFKTTDDEISKFHNLITPSSWPVATRQAFGKKVIELISLDSGASKTLITSISGFLKSHNLIVLSTELVTTFGLSLTSFFLKNSLNLSDSGSKAIIFITESVWPSISYDFSPIKIR